MGQLQSSRRRVVAPIYQLHGAHYSNKDIINLNHSRNK